MKGVILGGGLGERFGKFTDKYSKHMYRLGDFPLIEYPISRVLQAGVSKAGVVVSGDRHHIDSVKAHVKKRHPGFLIINQGKPEGIAHAIHKCRDFVGDGPLLISLGDQFHTHKLDSFVKNFYKENNDIRIQLKYDKNANRHTVIGVDKNEIISIAEKPEWPKEGYIMIGNYIIKPKVFDLTESLKKNKNTGLFEFSDVVKLALKKGYKVGFEILSNDINWVDVGTPENIKKALRILKSKPQCFDYMK